MRAVVYAVESREEWRARFSIAWEVDAAYWSDGGGRLCRLREPMPLGLAEAVCSRFNGGGRHGRRGGGGGGMAAESVGRELQSIANAVWDSAEGGRTGKRRENRDRDAWGADGLGANHLNGGQAGARRGWEAEEARLGAECGEGCGGERGRMGAGASPGERAAVQALEPAAGRATECLRGRSLLREEAAALLAEALQLAALRGGVRLAAAIAPSGVADSADAAAVVARPRRRRQELRCRRCGSGEERMRRTPCASCGRSGCAVCEACASLGRSRECGLLVLGAAPSEQPMAFAPDAGMDRWGLSPAQRDASAAAVRFLRENARRSAGEAAALQPLRHGRGGPSRPLPHGLAAFGRPAFLRRRANNNNPYGRSFLLWAVTGAGKTEMIFPLLDAVLRGGGRALVATPRRDVVLELAPRLAKAFPEYSRAVLYGGSEDRWTNAALTLATTHQLMRFQGAFDLVLIDELDAFPYHNDPLLHYAAAKSRKPSGATVLLSATPPASMQRAVRRGRLRCARVPVRYHRHPLPVPARIQLPPLYRWVSKGKLPAALGRELRHSVARGAQVFVFVPYIRHVDPLVNRLRLEAARFRLAPEAIDGTSSVDPKRAEKVAAFRQAGIRLLVTTTILERGVTIPRSDVFILDAHHPMFEEAALVQMAGRAGRSGDDPHGRVFFCGAHRTSFQRGAERQIRGMNRIARRRGYLLGKEEAAR